MNKMEKKMTRWMLKIMEGPRSLQQGEYIKKKNWHRRSRGSTVAEDGMEHEAATSGKGEEANAQ